MIGIEAIERHKALLLDFLSASARIADRLAWSAQRIAHVMPLNEDTVESLSEDDEESLDAFLHRFTSLVAMLQDSLGRSILQVEEEDLSSTSRKDQRLLLEKLGALEPSLRFGDMAILRNKISHHYPGDPAKQAEILTNVFVRTRDAIEGFNQMLAFANERHFGGKLDLRPVMTTEAESVAKEM